MSKRTWSFALPAWSIILILPLRGLAVVILAFGLTWVTWLWPAQVFWTSLGLIGASGVAFMMGYDQITDDRAKERFGKAMSFICMAGFIGLFAELVWLAIRHN